MRHLFAILIVVSGCSIPDERFRPSIDDAGRDTGATDTVSDGPACTENEQRCSGNSVTKCQGGAFTPIQTCDNLCTNGGCATPPSCGGGVAICGNGSETCCASLPVPGGMFSRSYDGVSTTFTDDRYKATLTAFTLDKYEVSVARFQKFIDAYPASKPAVGTGKNPRDAVDIGWKSEWTPLLPAAKTDLQSSLLCDGLTSQAASAPVRCVTWYVAQAFCIWDQGRLPTEAEWNFSASGGNQQRVYPWSVPATSTAIGATNAVYGGVSGPSAPGSHPNGNGSYGHADLAGNLNEWVFDNFVTPYPTDTCVDCANHTAATSRGVRGGSYASVAGAIITSIRSGFPSDMRDDTVGFRCARDPQP